MECDNGNDAPNLTHSHKKHRKKSLQKGQDTGLGTSATVDKNMSNLNAEVKVLKKVETTIGETSSGKNVTDNTVVKKSKRKKTKESNQDAGGILSTRESTQEGLSKTTTPDANMLSEEQDYTTEVTNGKVDKRENKPDLKNKRPTLAEILNPHYSESLEASKKQKRSKLKKNSDLGDVGSTRESTRDGLSTTKVLGVTSGETVSAKAATSDINMMSKEHDHAKVANGKEPKPKNKPVTLAEILNPHNLQNLEASKDEAKVSGSTATDNPVSKKQKRKLNKKSYSSDILSTEHESKQEVLSTAKAVVSKGDHSEVASGKLVESETTNNGNDLGTTARDNTALKKRKREKKKNNPDLGDNSSTREITQEGLSTTKFLEVKNDETVTVKTSTPDANTVLKEQDHTEVANVKKKRKKKPKSENTLPTSGENLNPMCLRNMEAAVIPASKEETKPKGPVKKLLILDVNGLLADVVSPRPKDAIADKHMHGRAIFKRPYLDDFLRFCFERFHVAIWSSRTWKKLDPLVYYLVQDLRWKLLFMWDRCQCTDSFIDTLEVKRKSIVMKDLRKIWDEDGPNNEWVKGTFNESNTLLVDDSPYKGMLNPKYTSIFPASYSYKNSDDNFLAPKGELQTYLEGLAAADDVRTYVAQHPFGQGAIDEQSPHWEFYSSVLERLNDETLMQRLLKKNRWKIKKCRHGKQKR